MRSLDRRTRRDDAATFVDTPTFFEDHYPPLVERHGKAAAAGLAHLGGRPLTLNVDGDCYTLSGQGSRLAVKTGGSPEAVVATLDAAQFSDFAQQLQTFNAMTTARRLRPENGTYDDLAIWDAVWLCLLEGWPVADEGLAFLDRAGTPLDLRRHFTPNDDPLDIAHFLREAGYLHLRGWTDPEAMTVIARDIELALPSYQPGDGRSWWATLSDGTDRCVRLQHFVTHSPTTAAMLSGDRWQQLRHAIAGDDELVQGPVTGNCIEALVKPLGVVKGVSDVPWHRDCNFGRHAYGCSGTIIGVSVTPGGADSGQLRAVGGSHRVCMPPSWAQARSYLPVVALPTEVGDLTVHLACTLHEAQPPLRSERLVMYTGFGLPPLPGQPTGGGKALSELRERAHVLQSQPPSPVIAT